MAHTAAFAPPGWLQVRASAASGTGTLAHGGSYVTRAAPDGSAFSIVCLKAQGSDEAPIESELAIFRVEGRLLQALQARFGANPPTLSVYRTNLGGSSSGNVSLLESVGLTTVYQPDAALNIFVFSVFLGTNTITTISTDSSFAKLETSPPPPRAVPTDLVLDWTDTASGRAPPQPPAFLVEVNGAFELVDDAAAGRGVQQTAASVPITRFGTDTRPHAIVGDEQWTDLDATARVWMPTSGDGAMLGVRCSGLGDGTNNHITGMDALPGLWLAANLTDWSVSNRLDKAALEISSGRFAVPLAALAWHSFRLVARGARLIVSVDGVVLASIDTALAAKTPKNGFAAIGSVAFGARPIFGGLTLRASSTTCSAAPKEGHKLVEETCEAESGGQRWSFAPVGDDLGTGQLQSTFNASLCIACNRSTDAEYRYKDTRAGFVALCNASDGRQLFVVEQTVHDGPYVSGPITGPDGLTLNIFGNVRTDNSDIAFYPFQGSSNAYWVVLPDLDLVYSPFYGSCLSACEDVT